MKLFGNFREGIRGAGFGVGGFLPDSLLGSLNQKKKGVQEAESETRINCVILGC